jgi:hypothetical protein
LKHELTPYKFEVESDALQVYLGWLYPSKIVLETSEPAALHRLNLCNLYLHAEPIGDTFQYAIMKLILSSLWDLAEPPTTLVTAVFNHTIVSTPLRNLLVDLKLRRMGHGILRIWWFEGDAALYPSGFVASMAHAILTKAQPPKTLTGFKKKYLQEDEDE